MPAFDPYYKWFGISPRDQPPNHYRLLGLAMFESDPEVIEGAVERHVAYLQDVANGPHVAESQRLLNEVAAARRCLLGAETRAAYDAGLRERLSRPPETTSGDASTTALPAANLAPDAGSAQPTAFESWLAVHRPPVAKTPTATKTASKKPAETAKAKVKSSDRKTVAAERTASANKSRSGPPRVVFLAGGGVVILVALIAGLMSNAGDDGSAQPKKMPEKRRGKPSPPIQITPRQEFVELPLPKPSPTKSSPGKPVDGRYVRVELPGSGTLTLAEVEVFVGGRNVARQGQASQKNTASGGDASRAIDGNTSGKFASKGQTHTQTTDRPWWEVDLRSPHPIERIVIHNRTESNLGERLNGFTLTILDAQRHPVWRRTGQPAPRPKSEFAIDGTTTGL